MKKYRCSICGYIHEEKIYENFHCPLCDASKELFQEVIEDYETKDINKSILISDDNPSIYRIKEKCINCGRCKDVCQNIVGVKYDSEKCKKGVCINCGQCILNCPMAAIVPKFYYKNVEQQINKDDKIVVALIAPATRVAIGEAFGMEPGYILEGKLVSALKTLGFDYVYDVSYGADLTIMEEASELVDRIKNNKNLPQFTSCCPSWVKYAEIYEPKILNHLSTTKSPISMQTKMIKEYFKNEKGINEENIITVAIAPCTSKKAEAKRTELNSTDFVLAVSELSLWIKERNINFRILEDSNYDNVFEKGSGSGLIFGTTGGVSEAVIRTTYYLLTDEEPTSNLLNFKEVRGLDNIKEATIKISNIELNIAVVYGLPNLQPILEDIKNNICKYQFIEVMNCPGGCIGGGGQPLSAINKQKEILSKRMAGLYECDRMSKIKSSYQNSDIIKLYKNYLGKPLSDKSKELLHTHYEDKSSILGE